MTGSLILLAVAPGLALMAWFYVRDRWEPEPRGHILKVMLGGALVVAPAFLLERAACVLLGLEAAPWEMLPSERALYSFGVVGLVEEGLKLAVVLALIYRDPEFDEPFDGIVYCVAAALGFAILENAKQVLHFGAGPGVARAFLTVPAHAMFGVAQGYFLGAARFAPRRQAALALTGLTLAVALHGGYDWLLFTPERYLLAIPFMAAMWLAAFAAMEQRLWESPFRPPTEEPGSTGSS